MTLAILTTTPTIFHGVEPVQAITVNRLAGGRAEQRAVLEDREYRTYRLTYRCHAATKKTLDAFFRARSWQKDSFLWRIPPTLAHDSSEYARTGISLGTSVALQTAFPLPTSGEYAGDYPVDDEHAILYDDGAAISKTVDVDNRKMTAGAAPAGSSVMTCDYWYYRRFRLGGPIRWEFGERGVWESEVVLEEVLA